MNKKAIKHILTLLYATYFLLVGVGYNVVNYCCNSCAAEGIETIATSSCNAVHEHSHNINTPHLTDDIACDNINHSPDSCHLLRLNIDIPSIQINTLSKVIVCIDLFYPIFALSNERPHLDALHFIQPPESHFQPSGREILALNAVFLI